MAIYKLYRNFADRWKELREDKLKFPYYTNGKNRFTLGQSHNTYISMDSKYQYYSTRHYIEWCKLRQTNDYCIALNTACTTGQLNHYQLDTWCWQWFTWSKLEQALFIVPCLFTLKTKPFVYTSAVTHLPLLSISPLT